MNHIYQAFGATTPIVNVRIKIKQFLWVLKLKSTLFTLGIKF